MSVYAHPTRHGVWVVKIFKGKEKPEYFYVEGDKRTAQDYERELRGQTDESDPGYLDRLTEFERAYKNEVSAGTYGDYEWAQKRLKPYFENCKLRHITPVLIENYKAQRLEDGVVKRTVNRELSYLSKYLNFCGLSFKPKKFRKKDCLPPLPDVLTIEELQSLIDNLQPPIKHLVQLMVYNGLRRSEAFTLASQDAEQDGSKVRIKGKGGKWRLAPIELPGLQKAIAAAKKANPDGVLFPNPKTGRAWVNIRKHLKKAADAAGIVKPVYNHLCRHSFATALVGQGVNLRVVQGLLGHADLKMTQIYTHLADDMLRAGASTLVPKPSPKTKNTAKSAIRKPAKNKGSKTKS